MSVPPHNNDPSAAVPDRETLALEYLDSLPFEPYPFQEEAILSWFDSDQGVLVCAPTGMGKTVVAEAGLYEALKTGRRAYYTTPLIALTEQKFRELREKVKLWGFSESDVGLITGNRRENPDAKILVVVAEILFNRLLSSDLFRKEKTPADGGAGAAAQDSAAGPGWRIITPKYEEPHFRFDDVAVVVMDEFHQFSDPERGIVWEFTLELLPKHVRTLLISATVGNAYEFIAWLRNNAERKLTLVTSDERKVPLTYQWIGDELLPEFLEGMHAGSDEERLVPALVFCFNRDQCWTVADTIKGKDIISAERQKQIAAELDRHDWSKGAGPKIRQLLLRGVGIHHAGILPKYRRIVEDLFQRKLLSITVCTETLAAGINLPARSVVLPTLLKGPAGDKRLVESSTAHQIFGRAGRPQYDTRGYVFALAHSDDVKIARFRAKYDQIPDDTKDPKLREMKKKLKKKMPTRNSEEQYWTEQQFQKLQTMSPGSLASHGPLPWRLLAHMIEKNSDVEPIRRLASRRLMGAKRLAAAAKALDPMLITLWRGGFIRLDPNPVDYGIEPTEASRQAVKEQELLEEKQRRASQPFDAGIFDAVKIESWDDFDSAGTLFSGGTGAKGDNSPGDTKEQKPSASPSAEQREPYRALGAYPTDKMAVLTKLRAVNPIYGAFLLEHLGMADRAERIQIFESLLEMPGTVARDVRVPNHNELPPGPLARGFLDQKLLDLGLASIEELVPKTAEQREEEREMRRRFGQFEEPTYLLPLADKLLRLFDWEYPGVAVKITPVWAAGEILLRFNGDFNKFIVTSHIQKQEGMIFRHLLRLLLLLEEFHPLIPAGVTPAQWDLEISSLVTMLTDCCRAVDPLSTEETLQAAARSERDV
ncbi:MAG: DEAD/DEAH box helicase [Thermoguttaceae bacterium]|nr:DEAD/DEAH box helicase [Thermoguttaceae bacterium]